tara:strand:- start:3027 stop:4127 length:1101 start_codon:yes stop_codon:yes gene_type:complete
MKKLYCVVILVWICFFPTVGFPQTEDYLKGYAQCVLDDTLVSQNVDLKVIKNTLYITITGQALSFDEEEQIKKRIQQNKHIKNVLISYGFQGQKQEVKPLIQNTATKELPKSQYLPQSALYTSPIADPRWPKFRVGYQVHRNKKYGANIFSFAFGENLPLYLYRKENYTLELGIQAGLFGLMNISHTPTLLINSDYFVGIGLSVELWHHWQHFLQLSHLSSHIGDELLINKQSLINKRINLSYETLRWLTAYKFKNTRPYFGIGYMIHRDPSSIQPLTIEYGIDYKTPFTFFDDSTRLIAGLHLHHWQQVKYHPTLTVAAGLQVENPVWANRKLQLLMEYKNGKSRDGQFFNFKEEYLGFLIVLAN